MSIAEPEQASQPGIDEARSAFQELSRALRRIRGRDARLADGMTFAQVAIVRHLAAGPAEGRSPTAIAAEASISPGALTEVVDTLERSGLAERVRDQRDRRRIAVRLTPEGRRRYEARVAEIEAVWQRHLAGLTPAELDAGVAFLRRIAGLLDEI